MDWTSSHSKITFKMGAMYTCSSQVRMPPKNKISFIELNRIKASSHMHDLCSSFNRAHFSNLFFLTTHSWNSLKLVDCSLNKALELFPIIRVFKSSLLIDGFSHSFSCLSDRREVCKFMKTKYDFILQIQNF